MSYTSSWSTGAKIDFLRQSIDILRVLIDLALDTPTGEDFMDELVSVLVDQCHDTIGEISKHHKELHSSINRMKAEIEKLREEIGAKDNIIKGEREKIQVLQKMIPEKEK